MPNSHGKRRSACRLDQSILASPELQGALFDGLITRRDGSVLSKSTILKSDQFGGGEQYSAFNFNLLGAPNFRQADLDVFGVAQPTAHGLSTILRLLHCGTPEGAASGSSPAHSCTWFSTREEPLIYINGRPFVIRSQEEPFENIRAYSGISAARLEQTEDRLKADILREAARNNGIILVHDEIKEYEIIPCLTAIDEASVKTSREVFADMQRLGFSVDYKRAPISHEQSPTDSYIDEYVEHFAHMPVERHAVIFSCGIGVGRTTYAMVIGMLLRRRTILAATSIDPFASACNGQERMANATLRLVSVIEQGLQSGGYSKRSAADWALGRGDLIDNLKAALLGNYHIVTALVRGLADGVSSKRLVDEAIDKCDELLNIREQILINRVKHYVDEESNAMDIAIGYLERYFSLICFAVYISSPPGDEEAATFSAWLRQRRDIWRMLKGLRRNPEPLSNFRPIDCLSALPTRPRAGGKGAVGSTGATAGRPDSSIEANAIKGRNGSVLSSHTLLKLDHWSRKGQLKTVIQGAPNYRQIPTFNIHASAQPTLDALCEIVHMITTAATPAEGSRVVWINVREEPVIYINGEPYVLRDRYATVRNIKSYSGIKADRLEQMEDRLKEDIIAEGAFYGGKVLVHSEAASESIFPSWITLEADDDVATLKEIFADLALTFPTLTYRRSPVTAEEASEPENFDHIFKAVMGNPRDRTHIVFNCQMGASRSTAGAVIAGLVTIWRDGSTEGLIDVHEKCFSKETLHYRIIHSILRVVPNGMVCKAVVDHMIDECAAVVNLRDCIEAYRKAAEAASPDQKESRSALRKGVAALKRYFLLILFQAYLFTLDPKDFSRSPPACKDDALAAPWTAPLRLEETFAKWLRRHEEFGTLLEELERKGGLDILHAGRAEVVRASIADHVPPHVGEAQLSDVLNVVIHRRGSVLAPMTILKFDHFPGCQKTSLVERLDGAPNFREVALDGGEASIYGLAMPTRSGVKQVLNRIGKPVLWLCLREEPVIYINDRPYVLRIVKDPVANLEMTGIVSERVELMEERLKGDILTELGLYSGKLLLHEEEASTGAIIPIWEDVSPDAVETTLEVMERAIKEGYPLRYVRMPITDEQAPIPTMFDQILRLVWDRQEGTHAIFNCQMGRGRTTTGMVICAIFSAVQSSPSAPSGICEPLRSLALSRSSDTLSEADLQRSLYLGGEYKAVMQLVQVLEHGTTAKLLADASIDRCAHIQNLRTAIYDFKIRESGERGVNYLLRYMMLIICSEYLIEMRASSGPPPTSFVRWLYERREIANVITRKDLIDLS